MDLVRPRHQGEERERKGPVRSGGCDGGGRFSVAARSPPGYTGRHGRPHADLGSHRARRSARRRSVLAAGLRRAAQMAAEKLAHQQLGQTLQATALVHEAYLRLVGGEQTQDWDGRRHFFAAAAEAMRRILIDRARQRRTAGWRTGPAGNVAEPRTGDRRAERRCGRQQPGCSAGFGAGWPGGCSGRLLGPRSGVRRPGRYPVGGARTHGRPNVDLVRPRHQLPSPLYAGERGRG